ncbi:AtpZ/AtpI family protein [Flavobacterium silvaticum]|uniref:AtpZ/AtpI family protein n=1 Tax=Flavobacterium silvaticum TaxID=1852020 RepID=A0A972JFV0_9FLAO|nr:AtpZ/AtpI family protein [Flavobacterium silvaticum]NMH28364.1 AtpZ/AtpI family protein [Flavobacterium silvaticum]
MPESPKNRNKWLALVNIPVQMGVIIFLFTWLGKYLDETYPNEKNWYVKVFVVLGVFVSLYNVNRQLKELNK